MTHTLHVANIPQADLAADTQQAPHVDGHERVPDRVGGIAVDRALAMLQNGNLGESMEPYRVLEVSPMGYGNPDAMISLAKNPLSKEIAEKSTELITSGSCMAKITDQDDGCMDGRGAIWAQFPDKFGRLVDDTVTPGKHLRAKLAGGGYLTSLAMKCALDSHDAKVDVELASVVATLTAQKIACGTHSGQHKNEGEGRTDCGANDNLDTIFEKGINYFGDITKTIEGIYTAVGLPYNEGTAHSVAAGWAGTIEHEGYFEGSTGESRHEVIMAGILEAQNSLGGGEDSPVAASKHLRGGHKEAFVVINFCEGQTFSQDSFRLQLAEQFPNMKEDQLPQVFVVDVPRIVKLAHAMARGREDETKSFDTALFAGVAYQFATAATLTDGSLRTFIVTQ
jgi:hypothetical protein